MLHARTLAPAALAALLLATGCSTPSTSSEVSAETSTPPASSPAATPSAIESDCAAPGEASEAVQVEGDFGSTLSLTSELPVASEGLQRSVLIEGDGNEIAQGSEITVSLTVFNGTSGDVVEAYPAASMIVSSEALMEWAYRGVNCATVGERTVVTLPATDVLGDQLEGSGFEATDTAVLLFDIVGQPPGTLGAEDLLPKADGVAQAAPAGFPTVELDEAGMPTITIPESADPPTELSVATLVTGEGEEVAAGDRVYVHYRGVIWRTGEEFDSSWSRGTPTDFVTTGVIGGFSEALVGQTVGSQVISLVPAATEQGGYGPDQLQQMGHEADDVMVFVLDILGTVNPG